MELLKIITGDMCRGISDMELVMDVSQFTESINYSMLICAILSVRI